MSGHRIELAELMALRRRKELALPLLQGRTEAMQAGSRAAMILGRGMDFEEHRIYQPGDDVRSIDWRVTARARVPHVRVYREERDRPVLLAVDLRPSMWFGTRRCFKAVLAAHIASIIGWAADHHGDRVGGLLLGQGRMRELRPAGGSRGVVRLLRTLAAAGQGVSTASTDDLAPAIERLRRLAHPASLAILLSDFRAFSPAAELQLRMLMRSVDTILVFVHDPLEAQLPPPGEYPVADLLGSRFVVDTSSAKLRREWQQAHEDHRGRLLRLVRSGNAAWLEGCTARPVHEVFGGRSSRPAA